MSEDDVKLPSFTEQMNKDIPPVGYLIDEIIPRAGVVFIFGPPGSFKTNFLLYACMRGADGQDVCGFEVKKSFKTLWIDEENRDIGMKEKILKISNGIDFNNAKCLDDNYISVCRDFQVIGPVQTDWLRQVIIKYKPDMVVIDSVAKVFPFDERDESQVKLIFTQLKPIIVKFGVTIVLIHHARKRHYDQESIELEDVAGSREFSAMADSIVLIEEKRAGFYLLKQVKNRYGQKCMAINFTVDGDKEKLIVEYSGTVRDAYRKKAEAIAIDLQMWIKEKNIATFTRKDAQEAMVELKHSESNIDNGLKILVDRGELTKPTRGKFEVIKQKFIEIRPVTGVNFEKSTMDIQL
jgi:RecA-family ATPase